MGFFTDAVRVVLVAVADVGVAARQVEPVAEDDRRRRRRRLGALVEERGRQRRRERLADPLLHAVPVELDVVVADDEDGAVAARDELGERAEPDRVLADDDLHLEEAHPLLAAEAAAARQPVDPGVALGHLGDAVEIEDVAVQDELDRPAAGLLLGLLLDVHQEAREIAVDEELATLVGHPQRALRIGPRRLGEVHVAHDDGVHRRFPDSLPSLLRGVSFRPRSPFLDHDGPRRPEFMVPVPRHLRAAAFRSLPVLPLFDAQPVGRRGPEPGRARPRLRHPRADGQGAAQPARLAVSRRVEPVDRRAAAAPRGAGRGRAVDHAGPAGAARGRRDAPRQARAAGARGGGAEGRLRPLARGDRRRARHHRRRGEDRPPPRARQADRGAGDDAPRRPRRRPASSTTSAPRSMRAISIG